MAACRAASRWLRLITAALAIWLAAAPRPAAAESGRPAGWQEERATEVMAVGRFMLRYEPHLEEEAQALAARAPELWSQVERTLAGDVADDLEVTLLDHAGGVADASGMPLWVAGVADSSSGRILVARHGPDGAPTELFGLLRHEMVHVALHRAVGGRALPRWFHEGVAESFGEGVSLRRAETLAGAVFGPGVPDLEGLEQAFRATEAREAGLAYAAARDLVSHLRDLDGSGARFRQLLGQLRQGHGFSAAFVRAYDRTLPQLVGAWREGLPGRFVWYAMIGGGGVPLALTVPLLAIAWTRRRRELARGWARLAAEDAASRAAAGHGAWRPVAAV
jgi:hypothetical protein